MAKYRVKVKGSHLVVKVKLSFKEKLKERQLEFFSSKHIRGLLKARLIGGKVIEYSGPVGVSLHERLKKPLSKFDFFLIMEQIVDVTQKLEKNGLSVNHLKLDTKSVFMNEVTRELQFIFLPLEEPQEAPDVLAFMLSIIYIYSLIPMEKQESDFIAGYAYFIKGLSRFDAGRIEDYISREDRGVVEMIKRNNAGQSEFMTDNRIHYYEHYDNGEDQATGLLPQSASDPEATGLLADEEATGLLADEEATGLLIDEEATGLLNGAGAYGRSATLVRCITNEVIPLNKQVFRVGKEAGCSDYCVNNNDKVSRSHADFVTRGEKYFIKDLNSKNGTFVNGAVISVGQEVEICSGDHIKLANEEFEFYV